VRHLPDARAGAELVARYLVAGATLVEDPDLVSAPVEVTTGLDFSGTRAEPAPAAPTTTLAGSDGSSTTAAPEDDVTTTTGFGIVPGEENDVCG
jgi:hypothetical protein